jgi:hypothetical protein
LGWFSVECEVTRAGQDTFDYRASGREEVLAAGFELLNIITIRGLKFRIQKFKNVCGLSYINNNLKLPR